MKNFIKSTSWSRIQAVLRYSGMNANQLSNHIGLPRAENLYQIKKGNNGISIKLAEKIVKKFPNIRIAWLLSGDGNMIRGNRFDLLLEEGVVHPEFNELEAISIPALPISRHDFFIAAAIISLGGIISEPKYQPHSSVYAKCAREIADEIIKELDGEYVDGSGHEVPVKEEEEE